MHFVGCALCLLAPFALAVGVEAVLSLRAARAEQRPLPPGPPAR